MLSCSGHGESEGKRKDPFLRTPGKRDRRIMPGEQRSVCRSERIENGGAGWTAKNCDSPGKPIPVRTERVEEATKKKQNGDYDSQEVYQKIADRLMDLFGI
jgi:hypothetical protein